MNFSDAVFAIAATVLVLSINFSHNLHQPDLDRKLWHEFGDVLPQVLAYALSFFIIARNWLAHHRMFRMIRRIDARFIAINITLLGLIALLPFPTDVYGNYPSSRPALIVYAASIERDRSGVGGTVVLRIAGQSPDRPVDPTGVDRPLAPAGTEHPGRVPHVDPDLVHRRQRRPVLVAAPDPDALLLQASLRQDHRHLVSA